ncbi:MAG TPA: hypothetical protein VJA47_00720, partial [archaeon]|nr:hypothetical protein [archaeon]
ANSSWIGSWDAIENGTLKSADIDKVELSLKHNVSDQIKSVIENFGSIPSGSISSVDFGGRQFFVLDAKKSSGLFRKEKINITEKRLETKFVPKKGYSFVFPRDNIIYNPLTFFNTPETCGNAKCDIGETHNTCWQDCACPEGLAATPSGCVPKTDISLEIVNIDKKDLECFIPPKTNAFNSVEGCGFFDVLNIKLQINNTPLAYILNQPYFDFAGKSYLFSGSTCTHEDGEVLSVVDANSTIKQLVTNSSKYSCTAILPPIEADQAFEEKKTLAVVFPITFTKSDESGRVIGGHELTAITSVNVKGTDINVDFSEIADMKRKAKEMGKDINKLSEYTNILNTVLLMARGIQFKTITCCTIPYSSLYCCPQASWWTVVSDVLSLTSIAYKEYMKHDIKEKMEKLEDERDRKIEESLQEVRSSVKQELPNLVWANGDKSGGYTGSVCGQENVEIWYTNFESFGCSKGDGLWFNFNNQSRPFCDCQSSTWVGNSIEPASCNCNSTSTDFSWVIKNEDGRDVGFKKYNPTDKHLLIKSTADKIFQQNSELNLTISCASNDFGDLQIGNIKSEFELLNYTATCGGL